MSGFVASAAATLAGRGVDDGDPGRVMGYHDGADVPVYHHLAEEFAVCDRWFSSVRGATLPNRLYALCGVAASPQWDRSLLIIVYDENGGFYDHVPPPQAADDEPEMFGTYGVRVPAIIVSPWIEPRTVSHTLFDHTSIINTILSRFCPKVLGQPQQAKGRQAGLGVTPKYPGLRVAEANHLGELLTRGTPRPAPPRDTLVRQAAARSAQMDTGQPRPSRRDEGEHPLNDLQKSILAATGRLRKDGHPPDAP
jgi:phospholipase C